MTDRPFTIRVGGQKFRLVPASDLVSARSLEHGIEIARELLATEQGRALLDAEHFGADPESAATRLGQQLVNGSLVLIRTSRPARLLDAPRVEPLVPQTPQTPDGPVPPEARPTWVELRCLGPSGESYAGARIRVRLPNRELRAGRLDGRSTWRADDVPSDGRCTVELLERQHPNPSAPAVENFSPSPEIPRIQAGGPSVGLSTQKTHTLVVAPLRAACVRLVGMNFALNKAFVLPGALEGIRLLKHMYGKYPRAELLVVGHTDRTGSAEGNRSLSLQRAESVVAYLQDDVERWLEFYSETVPRNRRWGKPEDLAMLAAMPRDHDPYYGPHHELHTFSAAVQRFQRAHALPDTGQVDYTTRRTIIAQYMSEDETTLPADLSITAHGCGEHFPEVDTADGVKEPENRRVEVFFMNEGLDPVPSSATSTEVEGWYLKWRESVDEERTFRPSAEGLGFVRLVTDIEAEFAREAAVSFLLESVDGTYSRLLVPEEHGETVQGYVDLVFEDVPRNAFLSLWMRDAEGGDQALFEDVPYAELSRIGDEHDDELVDPFTLEPVA